MGYDILLVHAQRNYIGRANDQFQQTIVGLDMLAACAEEKGYSARVYNGEVNAAAARIEREITNNQVRLIGFYCHYGNQSEVEGLSRLVKKNWGLPVLVGGPQSVALGGDFLFASGADVIVRGEGEITFLELLDYYLEGRGSLHETPGIVFRNATGEAVTTTDRELIRNLDVLPFPKIENRISEKDLDMISILSGRGCPYSCSFCYEGHNTKTVRYRSVANVLAEVEQRLERGGKERAQYVTFNDDTFTLNPSRVLEICAGLRSLRKRYDFVWFCEAHVQTIIHRPDIVPVMIEAGLVRLQLGLESGVQSILNAYNKQITPEQIAAAISICAKHDLPMVFCNVIVGGAFETKDTIEETERFVDRLMRIHPGMLEVGTMLFIPYPRTAMTVEPEKFGLCLLDSDSETSMGDYPVAETASLNREEINRLNLWLRSRINTLAFGLRDSIPQKRALKIFQLAHKYQISGLWFMVFTESEHIGLYARRMMNGGKCFSEIPPEEIPSMRPMRTLSFLKRDGAGLSINQRSLTALDADLIRHCSGKLKVAEIVQRLHPLHGAGMSIAEFGEKVVHVLRGFEQLYWVSLSVL